MIGNFFSNGWKTWRAPGWLELENMGGECSRARRSGKRDFGERLARPSPAGPMGAIICSESSRVRRGGGPRGGGAASQRRGTGFSHGSVLHLRLRKTLDFSVVFFNIASHERHSGNAPDDAGPGAGRVVPGSRRGTKEGGGECVFPGRGSCRGMYLEGRNRSLQWLGEGGRMKGKQRNCIQELP